MYLIRLDDASEYMNIEKWDHIEKILDRYSIKPIVGVIPQNEDKSLVSQYKKDELFWKKVSNWQKKGWTIAMHGYNHVYTTFSGGINPVQKRSEFAGLKLEEQKEKIKKGIKKLQSNNIFPNVFFAPSHTFDINTIIALKSETDIKIISDTIATNIYYENDMFFIPQQSGQCRKLPFKVTTFCYHPNTMTEDDFIKLENFINKNINKICGLEKIKLRKRNRNIVDNILKSIYFYLRK